MPNKITTVLDENKREQGIELFIVDSQDEGRQIKVSLTDFLRMFETPKERSLVRTAVHSALRMTPPFPTLRQLHEEGTQQGENYAIDDGYTSNGGDGSTHLWRGRLFEVIVYNGAGEHSAGEINISEIKN